MVAATAKGIDSLPAAPLPAVPAAPDAIETEEEKEAKLEKMKKIVAQTPGAAVFTEGMKLPGQEEREENEAEWMRGDFDPVGDLCVTGRRLMRGEGRRANEATGPQCKDWDDIFITLRGTAVCHADQPFFASRGAEAELEARPETHWLVELSDPRLSDYWRKSFRAMSRGDFCRFTCAAKRSQSWLQNLVDCVLPDEDSQSSNDVSASSPKLQVDPSGRDRFVDVRLDRWLPVTDIHKKGPPLYKRVLKHSSAQLEMLGKSPEEQLQEELRHAGELQSSAEGQQGGRSRRREPRAPDRVRVSYSIRRRTGQGALVTVLPLHGGLLERTAEFNLGVAAAKVKAEGPSVSAKSNAPPGPSFPALEECITALEVNEHASFTFAASAERLPLECVQPDACRPCKGSSLPSQRCLRKPSALDTDCLLPPLVPSHRYLRKPSALDTDCLLPPLVPIHTSTVRPPFVEWSAPVTRSSSK